MCTFLFFLRLSGTYTPSLDKMRRPLSTCERPQNLIHVMPRLVWFNIILKPDLSKGVDTCMNSLVVVVI